MSSSSCWRCRSRSDAQFLVTERAVVGVTIQEHLNGLFGLGPGQILRMRTHGLFIGHFGPGLEWPTHAFSPALRRSTAPLGPGPLCLPPATAAR